MHITAANGPPTGIYHVIASQPSEVLAQGVFVNDLQMWGQMLDVRANVGSGAPFNGYILSKVTPLLSLGQNFGPFSPDFDSSKPRPQTPRCHVQFACRSNPVSTIHIYNSY